jgi:hypothetical protein
LLLPAIMHDKVEEKEEEEKEHRKKMKRINFIL